MTARTWSGIQNNRRVFSTTVSAGEFCTQRPQWRPGRGLAGPHYYRHFGVTGSSANGMAEVDDVGDL